MFVNTSNNANYVNKSNKESKQFNNKIIEQNQLTLIDKYKNAIEINMKIKDTFFEYDNRFYKKLIAFKWKSRIYWI